MAHDDTGTPDEARRRRGLEWYEFVTRTPAPAAADAPYMGLGLLDFVFSEVWSRPGLERRIRRWISLSCAAATGTQIAMESHVYAALKSGDCSIEEMNEFVLHFAVYQGWPKGSTLQIIVAKAWAKVQAEGGPIKLEAPQP
jgi:4-carboxymuconolactone decarboxylase